MPWQETCPVDERLRFVREHRRQELSMSELCRAFGISRRTGYKWLARFEERGRGGLLDVSRAPATHPNATPVELEELILELRQMHRTWGPRKLRAWLQSRFPERSWPVTSTFGDILRRHGLTRPKPPRRRASPSQPLSHADEPNAVWCADFKGWFRTGDGCRCDPLTISDAFSRYLLCARAVEVPDGAHVKPVMEATFREYGLPRAMRTDNGPPFASLGRGGLSRLSVWLVRLGVRPERIAPGKPEQNGRHERMHRTMKAETASPPAASRVAQQRTFERFRRDYNEERPHEALGMNTPASIYVPSPKPFPRRLPELEYPSGVELRTVRHNGEIKWAGELIYVSDALVGQVIGLEPLDGRHWRMHFGPVELGCIDGEKKRWATEARNETGEVLSMCPV